MSQFWKAAAAEWVSFFIIVLNTRAFTQGSYFWTLLTDFLFITQAFFVAKWMIEAKEARSWSAYWGFVTGGTWGSLTAIWVSEHLYKGGIHLWTK